MNRFTKFQQQSDTPRRPRPQIKLSLTDSELKIVMDTAGDLPYEKRSLFLQRLAAQLAIRSGGLEMAIQRALTGLLQR